MVETSWHDVTSILAAKFCMKECIIESTLRDLGDDPIGAATALVTMPFDDALDLLFQKVWSTPLETLRAAPWAGKK